MADLPIPFTAPMVRALLREIEQPGTGKTQTRRVIEPYETTLHPFKGSKAAPKNLIQIKLPARLGGFVAGPVFNPRYAVGDRLYVRENWRVSRKWDATKPSDLPLRTMTVMFEAGGSIANQQGRGWSPDHWPAPGDPPVDWMGRFRQGLHMPKWASRITLIVTEVRVQRLQEISDDDVIAEGIRHSSGPLIYWAAEDDGPWAPSPVVAYRELWDSINDDPDRPGCAWRDNPWVAAYTFRPFLGNIDQVEP